MRELARAPSEVPVGVTAYGCSSDETALLRDLAPRHGILAVVTHEAVSEATTHLAAGNRHVSIDHKTHVSNTTLSALRNVGVEYISTRSIGSNHLDVDYAASVGITVGTVAYSPDSVADYTLMLMLMVLRRAAAGVRRVDAHDYRLSETRGRELRDLTVGVIGTGRIGTAVIDRLSGFGCRILTHDVSATASVDHVALDALLGSSDIVTLHTPLTPETHHLLNRHRIARMKHGAIVVNTARGALLDTDALIRALEWGHLGGAALDVLEGEEGVFYTDRRGQRVEHRSLEKLQGMPNVLITPHTAFHTDHALRDVIENTLRNCVNYEKARTS